MSSSEKHDQPDPDAWGVATRYQDVSQKWHEVPDDTMRAVLAAMGASTPEPISRDETPPVLVVSTDATVPPITAGAWAIALENGDRRTGSGALPADLPLGYHDVDHAGGRTRLIVTPEACPTPGPRRWGWATQLYAMRSRRSWGVGDLGDLRMLIDRAASDGAGVVLINPLHATLVDVPMEPSPYYPSSREFVNPLYLRMEDVPGADEQAVDLGQLASQARALNGDRRIDRDAVWRLKADALDRIWRHTRPGADFEQWRETEGDALERYAAFCVLTEQHGRPWTAWPSDVRHPAGSGVDAVLAAHADRVRFHQWLQWLLDSQLAAVTAGVDIHLVQDLAVGVDPAGADAWLNQDVTALGMRVGAPPDQFNTRGQDWGLPPFDPWALRRSAYAPFARIVRANLAHAGALRVDHVMGLFRLFWVPEGASPSEGTYVHYPWRDLLGVLALEAHRAGAIVVGEDLGTVEAEMREELAARNVLSYKLLWFEDQPPSTWKYGAMAAVTTHDLPSVAGLWTGSDLEDQHRLGMAPNEEATAEMRGKVARWTGLDDDASALEAVVEAHRLLAEASSSLVAASLDDALVIAERPNYPGTTSEYPNWSVALPVALEEIADTEGYRATVRAFARPPTKASPSEVSASEAS